MAADLVRNGVPSGSGQRIGSATVRPLRAAQEANLDEHPDRAGENDDGDDCRAGHDHVQSVGPYARLRPGTSLGEGVRIGNFVETKAATIEAGAKVNHLSYVGDAHVGANANLGAGTITCNDDGFFKHKTTIDTGAFIGTNSSLVAPVKIGNGAYIGSGSVITKDVPDDAMAVERSQQSNREGGPARYREMKLKAKGEKEG
jgi:bifunctional UDP-N-acetylglucosamine pyrophosphorylase / glucosamine-1-phosphate N-acetyltransferase